MAERFKAPVLKTGVGASPPWVRIPLPPPDAVDLLTLSYVSLVMRYKFANRLTGSTSMLSRQIDAQELYVRIGHHIEAMPARMEIHSAEKEIWVSQAVALVEAVGNLQDMVAIRDAAEWYSAHPNIYANSFWLILQRALARAELAAPASSSGSFLPVGSQMDAMTAIGKVLKEARSRLLIVDPYLDHTILTDFAAMATEGVKIDLLSDGAAT
jgi:hypothetical protein